MFIELRAKYDEKFANKKYQSNEVLKQIASELDVTGHLDWQKCRKKWDNLRRIYKDLKYPPTGSGTDGGKKAPRLGNIMTKWIELCQKEIQ